MNRKKWFTLGIVGFSAIIIALICWYAGRPLVQFVSEPEQFRSWVDTRGVWGRLAFIGMVALQVIAAVIPGEPFEIVAGYAFGAWEGALLCLIGIAAGSTAIFFAVRKWGMKLVGLFFDSEKVRNLPLMRSPKKLELIALIVFAIPGTPKDMLTYAGGLTPIRPVVWLVLTTVARFPSVISSTLGGSALGEQRYATAILVFLITMLISLGGILLYHRFERKTAAEAEQNNAQMK